MTTDRALFEGFNTDPQYEDLRKLRFQLQPVMEVLLSNVRGFQRASSTLDPGAIQRVREYVLQMLQLEYAMSEACKNMPVELEPVKLRILQDFDTKEPKAYLMQVNGWLRLIEGAR